MLGLLPPDAGPISTTAYSLHSRLNRTGRAVEVRLYASNDLPRAGPRGRYTLRQNIRALDTAGCSIALSGRPWDGAARHANRLSVVVARGVLRDTPGVELTHRLGGSPIRATLYGVGCAVGIGCAVGVGCCITWGGCRYC